MENNAIPTGAADLWVVLIRPEAPQPSEMQKDRRPTSQYRPTRSYPKAMAAQWGAIKRRGSRPTP
jgi:hypothetical protein